MIDIRSLLDEVIARNASDLHIGAGLPPALRIDGELTFLDGAMTPKDSERALRVLLSPEQFERLLAVGDLDFAISYEGRAGVARFRGNAYREMRGLSAAFRLIPARVRTLDELGLPAILREIAGRRRGLFLVTGPAGHGKSTTLAALVHEINHTRRAHIITLEDPIEFIHTLERCLIHQRELGMEAGGGFASALRQALRQDPDVILIGELRDLETISAAITAAETGHLVLGTLHTQDAPQSVDRLIDVFPPSQQPQVRTQLSLALAGILSQQLVPRAAGSGRVCAAEILTATPAVRSCIREGKTSQIRSLLQTGTAVGMRTMEQDLARLVWTGIISGEAAAACAYDAGELARLLGSRTPGGR